MKFAAMSISFVVLLLLVPEATTQSKSPKKTPPTPPTRQTVMLTDMLGKINKASLEFQALAQQTGDPRFVALKKDADAAIIEVQQMVVNNPNFPLEYYFVRGYINHKGTVVYHYYRRF